MKANFETERLIIRNLVPGDYEQAYKWCGDPIVNKYMIYPLYKNAEDVKSWIMSLEPEKPNTYDYGWVLKESGDLIGCGGAVYHTDKDVWNIGYNLSKEYWGKGYTLEAIRGIIKYINETRKTNIIEGQFAVDNNNSKRVMEKLGMSYSRDGEYEKLDGSIKFKSKIYRMEM